MDLSDFSYESKYCEANGSNIHYVEDGSGDPIVFIHGIPTWSYLWRNVIPLLKDSGRCIALDLIGCGYSDKPDITYSITDHIEYFEAFMKQMELSNVTLFMHGWGSIVGANYAVNHPDKIKGLAFLESHLRLPSSRDDLSLPIQEIISMLEKENIEEKVLGSTFYIERVLQSGVIRRLDAEELAHYLLPFEKAGSRQVIWQYLQEFPRGNHDSPVNEIISNYSNALKQSSHPKLLMIAMPGFLTTMDTVSWACENFPKLEVVEVGEALHYAQESEPEAVGAALRAWYESLS